MVTLSSVAGAPFQTERKSVVQEVWDKGYTPTGKVLDRVRPGRTLSCPSRRMMIGWGCLGPWVRIGSA